MAGAEVVSDSIADFTSVETDFLRGVPSALGIAALLVLISYAFLTGFLRYGGMAVVVLLMFLFWWKVLSHRTTITITGFVYTLDNGAGDLTQVDLSLVTKVHWEFIPFQGSRVSLLEYDRVLLDLPCSRSRRSELLAVGRAISASKPGRTFSDRRATRALGLR